LDVLCITAADCRVLAARYTEHGNSHRRLRAALLEAGAAPMAERLSAFRALERKFDLDLGEVCHRYLRREQPGTHPLERMILGYIVEPRRGGEELWILLDRVRQLRELKEGRLVGEPGT
jgi:hypothetical protein